MTTECTQLVFGFHSQKRPFDERSGLFSSGEGSTVESARCQS